MHKKIIISNKTCITTSLGIKWFRLWRWTHWFLPKVLYRYARIHVITRTKNYTVWKL